MSLFNNNYNLTKFEKYNKKTNGVILSCRHRENSGIISDVAYKRLEIMKNIEIDGRLESHCFGLSLYGGKLYKGVIGRKETEETFPSSLEKLKIYNTYKFALCLENCYHELWGWDWITEKLRDAMKAKTIGIAWGVNLKQVVPENLYIDYNDFETDSQLIDKLINISENEYEDIVEQAYEWNKNCRLGNIDDLKEVLNNL